VRQVASLVVDDGFEPCLAQAETMHVHVKVDATGALPAAALEAAGAVLDHGRDGFVKYRLPGGINAIFSHIAVSTDDLHEASGPRKPRPFLDHIGIDVRGTDVESEAAFHSIPALAAARAWAWTSQGAMGKPVRCCHVEVGLKHWMYPTGCGARPIEIAFGPLKENPGGSGCDLRPTRPGSEATASACCPERRPRLEAGESAAHDAPGRQGLPSVLPTTTTEEIA
jgi:hypothetical protein